MGFAPEVAKRAVWQFLNKVDDPRISTLRKFAKALGVKVKDLFRRISSFAHVARRSAFQIARWAVGYSALDVMEFAAILDEPVI